MKGYLIDTCFISELVKSLPDVGVIQWLNTIDEDSLYLSVLTLGELRKGVEGLSDGKKKSNLGLWLENDLPTRFRGRIIPVDEEVCDVWGRISANLAKQGRHAHVVDVLISATALSKELILVSRNTADVEATGVRLINPWRTAT